MVSSYLLDRELYPYAALLADDSQAAEKKRPYQLLKERHCQIIWLEQKYFKKLKTIEGEAIEVISPGIWNAGAGPDFLKAHIKIGERVLWGGIEIHLSEEDWYHHGHHLDERYNSVVLHISFWKSFSSKPLLTLEGKKLPQAFLEEELTVSPGRLLHLIDLDLYPYKSFVGSGRCAHRVFKDLSPEHIRLFFEEASKWRLVQKGKALQQVSPIPAEQLGAGIARALGYKNNAASFLSLFLLLSTRVHEISEEELLAFGLRVCGFFGDSYKKWEGSEYYRHLEGLGEKRSLPISPLVLVLAQIRPLNHPIRRIVYLIKLLRSRMLPVLHRNFLTLWEQRWPQCKERKHFYALGHEMRMLFPNYEDEYWNSHYLFEQEKTETQLVFLGEDFKNTLLINAVLPLIYDSVRERANEEECRLFYKFFYRLPEKQSGKSKYLAHRFFGDSSKGQLLKLAPTQQGAYQLHHDFCVHYEASCVGCPFVQRYIQNSPYE